MLHEGLCCCVQQGYEALEVKMHVEVKVCFELQYSL